jgi:hypothetical protein
MRLLQKIKRGLYGVWAVLLFPFALLGAWGMRRSDNYESSDHSSRNEPGALDPRKK